MKKLSLLFVCILTIASCVKDALTEEVSIKETVQNSDVYARQGNKVAVCHKNGEIIYVNENAIPAHTAHGDAVDMDGDGFFNQENSCSAGVDCDDTNPTVNPDAVEIYTDEIDNNCNGVVGYIATVVINAECTGCVSGFGNYWKIKRGKRSCRYFTSPPDLNIWTPCGTEEEVYIDY